MIKRGILDIENSHDGVERAVIAHVTELGSLDVVRNGVALVSNGQDVAWGHIDELPKWIDEAADQPWTSNAVDLGVLAGYPFVQGPADIAAGWQASVVPASKAVHQIVCIGSEPLKRFHHRPTPLPA